MPWEWPEIPFRSGDFCWMGTSSEQEWTEEVLGLIGTSCPWQMAFLPLTNFIPSHSFAQTAQPFLAASEILLEFEVALYLLLGRGIFLSFSLRPLHASNEGLSVSAQAARTDSWYVTVCSTRSRMHSWAGSGRSENCFWTQIVYNDWPHRHISPHSRPSCLRRRIEMVGCFRGCACGTMINVKKARTLC